MSRFYGSLTGLGKSAITRCGTPVTGLIAKADGWAIGARIELSAIHDNDIVRLYATAGSNKGRSDFLVLTITRIGDTFEAVMPNGNLCAF